MERYCGEYLLTTIYNGMLHRFESFVPKNLDTRQEKWKLIKIKEEQELKELANKLQKTVETFKDLKIKDKKEQFFIKNFIGCLIKIDDQPVADENLIFFYDKNDNYLAEYNPKTQEFWINYDKIMDPLLSKYDLNYPAVQKLTKAWVEEHFKLKSVNVEGMT